MLENKRTIIIISAVLLVVLFCVSILPLIFSSSDSPPKIEDTTNDSSVEVDEELIRSNIQLYLDDNSVAFTVDNLSSVQDVGNGYHLVVANMRGQLDDPFVMVFVVKSITKTYYEVPIGLGTSPTTEDMTDAQIPGDTIKKIENLYADIRDTQLEGDDGVEPSS